MVKNVIIDMSDSELEEMALRRQGEMLPNRRDLFAANAPEMPEWFMKEYVDRNSRKRRFDLDGMAEAKASGILLDAEVQWRWEFAERMVRLEHERK